MAGLGEVCSHIGAILFAVEAGIRMLKSRTCTSLPCTWLMPTAVNNVPYAELRHSDFTAAKTKKRKLDEAISGIPSQPCTPNHKAGYVPSSDQIGDFFKYLHASGTQPVILSLVAPYSEHYKTQSSPLDLPKSLDYMYDEQFATLAFPDLLAKANEVFEGMTCSQEQAGNVEEATREQRKSELWFEMRRGRVTASNFHQVCHTDLAKPSISLIKQICYTSNFQSEATKWGCRQEEKALDQYKQVMGKYHTNFSIEKSGLWINPDYPHLGATPDGMTHCDCHGSGCVEVKCPFSVRDQDLYKAVNDGQHRLCLERAPDGSLALKKSHPYWDQVQVQMNVTGCKFSDFVVWTVQDLHVERIACDNQFFKVQLGKVNELYKSAILPELLAKWYTKPSNDIQAADSTLFCYCRVGDSDSLVLVCSGSSCVFRKFHMKCCGLSRRPPVSRAWLCADCKRKNWLSSTHTTSS